MGQRTRGRRGHRARRGGYRQWRQTPLADRADALRRIGALRARGEEVAQMITRDGQADRSGAR